MKNPKGAGTSTGCCLAARDPFWSRSAWKIAWNTLKRAPAPQAPFWGITEGDTWSMKGRSRMEEVKSAGLQPGAFWIGHAMGMSGGSLSSGKVARASGFALNSRMASHQEDPPARFTTSSRQQKADLTPCVACTPHVAWHRTLVKRRDPSPRPLLLADAASPGKGRTTGIPSRLQDTRISAKAPWAILA